MMDKYTEQKTASELLLAAGIEVGDDTRSTVEIAMAFGLLGVSGTVQILNATSGSEV